MIGKPDIVQTVQQSGLELKQRGNRFWGCCPFHFEKTASFCVDADKQKFNCWGCHESGDVIDFVMKRHNLSFKEALKHLRIDNSNNYKDEKKNSQLILLKELRNALANFEREYAKKCCEIIRVVNRIDLQISKLNFDSYDLRDAFLEREIAQYHFDVLSNNSIETKLELFKEKEIRTCMN